MKNCTDTEKRLAITELRLIHLDMLNVTRTLNENEPLNDLLKSYESLKKRYDAIDKTIESLSEDSMQHRCDLNLMYFEMLISFIKVGFKKMEDLIAYLGGEPELAVINEEPSQTSLRQKIKGAIFKTA